MQQKHRNIYNSDVGPLQCHQRMPSSEQCNVPCVVQVQTFQQVGRTTENERSSCGELPSYTRMKERQTKKACKFKNGCFRSLLLINRRKKISSKNKTFITGCFHDTRCTKHSVLCNQRGPHASHASWQPV